MLMIQPNDNQSENYEQKFSVFIKMCNQAKQNNAPQVLINHPTILGDTYEEVIESLSRLADAELSLRITSR